MLRQKNSDGKTEFTNLAKIIASALTVVALIAGGVIYMETTYFHTAAAQEMKADIEKSTVETFKQQQEILQLEKKDFQRTMDMRYLEQLRTQKALIDKELERNPNDTRLKDAQERLNLRIMKLEEQLF